MKIKLIIRDFIDYKEKLKKIKKGEQDIFIKIYSEQIHGFHQSYSFLMLYLILIIVTVFLNSPDFSAYLYILSFSFFGFFALLCFNSHTVNNDLDNILDFFIERDRNDKNAKTKRSKNR